LAGISLQYPIVLINRREEIIAIHYLSMGKKKVQPIHYQSMDNLLLFTIHRYPILCLIPRLELDPKPQIIARTFTLTLTLNLHTRCSSPFTLYPLH